MLGRFFTLGRPFLYLATTASTSRATHRSRSNGCYRYQTSTESSGRHCTAHICGRKATGRHICYLIIWSSHHTRRSSNVGKSKLFVLLERTKNAGTSKASHRHIHLFTTKPVKNLPEHLYLDTPHDQRDIGQLAVFPRISWHHGQLCPVLHPRPTVCTHLPLLFSCRERTGSRFVHLSAVHPCLTREVAAQGAKG